MNKIFRYYDEELGEHQTLKFLNQKKGGPLEESTYKLDKNHTEIFENDGVRFTDWHDKKSGNFPPTKFGLVRYSSLICGWEIAKVDEEFNASDDPGTPLGDVDSKDLEVVKKEFALYNV